jgi:hypothetical protein
MWEAWGRLAVWRIVSGGPVQEVVLKEVIEEVKGECLDVLSEY